VSSAVAVRQRDPVSLLALRTRAIRFWLAAIGLAAFGLAYAGPLALALRVPAVGTPVHITPLSLPTIQFPALAVPKLHAPPVVAPVKVHPRVVRHRALVHRVPPAVKPARRVHLPVVRTSYSLLPPGTDSKPARAKRDPFARVQVVDDTVGVEPDTSLAAPAIDPVAIDDTLGAVPPDATADGSNADAAPADVPAAASEADASADTATYTEGYRRLASSTPPSTPIATTTTQAPTTSGDTNATATTDSDATTSDTSSSSTTSSGPTTLTSTTTTDSSSSATSTNTNTPQTTAARPAAATATKLDQPATVWQVDGGKAKASPHEGDAWNHKLHFQDGNAELVSSDTGASDAVSLVNVTSIEIDGGDANDVIAIDTPGLVQLPVTFDGGAGSDTIVGPAADATWTVSGADRGTVAGVTFANVENLQGAPANDDTFVFEVGGSVSGTVDGGVGGSDRIVLPDGGRYSAEAARASGIWFHYFGIESISAGARPGVALGASGAGVTGAPLNAEAAARAGPDASETITGGVVGSAVIFAAATATPASSVASAGAQEGVPVPTAVVSSSESAVLEPVTSQVTATKTSTTTVDLEGVAPDASTLAVGSSPGAGVDATSAGSGDGSQLAAMPAATAAAGAQTSQTLSSSSASTGSATTSDGETTPTSATPSRPDPAAVPGSGPSPPAATPWMIAVAMEPDAAQHAISLQLVGGDLVVTIDGTAQSRPLTSVESLTITGSSGDDTLTLDDSAASLLLPISFDGGAGSDTVCGPVVDSTWTIDGPGSGNVGALSFAVVEDVRGAANNEDTFVLGPAGSLAGTVDGGPGGFDSIAFRGTAATIVATIKAIDSGTVLRDGVLTTYAGMEPAAMSCTICVVTGTSAGETFTIRQDSDSSKLDVVVSSGETHVFTNVAATVTLKIDGAEGDDTLIVESLPAAFRGALVLDGGDGTDTLRGKASGSTWRLSGTDAGALDGAAFSNIENLTGADTGPDFFTIGDPAKLDGIIDGGFDVGDTINGPDADTAWEITGVDAGATLTVRFTGIDHLVGGSAADAFSIDQGARIGGGIDGGGGSDAIVAPVTPNEWFVTGANAGAVIVDVHGAGTTTAFTSIENLIGRSRDDAFFLSGSGSISGVIEGGAADADADPQPVDTLDLSALAGPVSVQLTGGAAAIEYVFATATADADPGTGTIRLGSATQNTSTVLRADGADSAGSAVATLVDAFDDPPGTLKGELRLTDVDDSTNWLTFFVTAVTLPGGGGYRNISLTPVDSSSASPFTDGARIVLTFTPLDPKVTGVGGSVVVGSFVNIDGITGTSAVDTVHGPSDPFVTWTVSGPNETTVNGITFSDFENLVGASENNDVFVVQKDGSIGSVDGGTGGHDGVVIYESDTSGVFVNVTGADSSGTVTEFGKTIAYAGLDHIDVLSGNDVTRKVSGTFFNDRITLRAGTTPGTMTVHFEGIGWWDASTGDTTHDVTFNDPISALVIEAKEGTDTITVESLDAGWQSDADLDIYGSAVETGGPPVVVDQPYVDTVTFSGSVNTNGGAVNVYAQKISVAGNVTLTTSDLTFRARLVGISTLENLLPAFGTDRDVSIDIGAGATINADGGIYLIAEAVDQSLADTVGASKEVDNFIIAPLADKVAGLTALPVKVLVKSSTATIAVHDGAQLIGTETVGLYATAGTDAGGVAKGSLFSIGYAQATSHASVDVGQNVTITSGAAIVITASGEAEASMDASTDRTLESTPNPGSKQVALALAVSYADSYSHVTVAKGSTIEAQKTANIVAGGSVKSEAKAESGIFADGAAGLAFGLQFSKADILTTIDGTVVAHMVPGSVVKIEIDPLETDPSKVGYIDYARDMIHVGDSSLVTEDIVTYTNRRGTSIGGLVDGREYFVVNVGDDETVAADSPSEWIKLAGTDIQAIRAGIDPKKFSAGNVVDLTPLGGDLATADNVGMFSGSDVDAAANSISLPRSGNCRAISRSVCLQTSGANNTFELGQAVVYKQGTAPIPGLVDGNTYYIVASTNQTNLQGDTRFTETQVFGLAETENEARGGVLIDIGAPTTGATGYSFAAKHVLDSDYATGVGIVAKLDAEASSGGTAGLKNENSNTNLWAKFKELKDKNLPDLLFTTLTEEYKKNQAAPNAGSSNELSVAGAFAFTFVDQSVVTEVGADAVVKSNEDLEVKATIAQKLTVDAESSVEPQNDKTGESAGTSAKDMVSVAVAIAVVTNTATATVGGGASLDGLRATRVISDVSYPFLTRFDQYIPLSWGEFSDSIRNEGYGAVTKYLDTTLGLKDAFFNSWSSSTAKADELGIAGSVTVLVLTNVSEATVKSNAKINQDLDWRDATKNPHTNDVPGSGAAGNEGEQVVSIEATNYQQFVDMVGIFSLPDIDLDTKGAKFKDRLSLNPVGTAGEKGGFGGAFYISVQNNTTHAIVQDGAKIYSGFDGGFNMKAEEALFHIDLVQSGASGGKFAIAGSIAYIGQTSDTLVQVGHTAEITGRDARLYAGDLTTQITWVGGIAKGEGLGLGISVAINNLDRKTRAVIGDPDTADSAQAAADRTNINVTGSIDVLAKVDGDLAAFSVAGAISSSQASSSPSRSPTSPSPSSPASPTPSPSAAPSISVLGQSVEPPPTGIGLAGAASVNILRDTTQASIADAGTIGAGSVAVTGTDDLFQLSVTGAAAFVVKEREGSKALAGAFSLNDLDVTTRAFVIDTDVTTTTRDLALTATRSGDLISLSAGMSGAAGSDSISVAGSVSLNIIFNETRAYLGRVVGDVSGDVCVDASDTSRIIAVGGGVAVGGKAGVGAGLGANVLGSDDRPTITRAAIENSSLTIAGTKLDVIATNANPASDPRIFAVGAGVGVSFGAESKIGLGAYISLNLTTDKTEAYVKSSTITDKSGGSLLNVTIKARDDSGIVVVAGAVAVSQSNAVGIAIGYNEIDNDVLAYVDDVGMTIDGSLTLEASSDAEIGGADLGVAVAAGANSKLAGAGSILINLITNTIKAYITDTVTPATTPTVSTGGTISLSASDDSLIVSIAGGVSVSTQSNAVGAAVSYNLISNTIEAYVENTSLDARGASASITVGATSGSKLVAVAVGAAVGDGNIALGGSLTVNSVANTLDAHIKNAPTVQAGDDVQVTATESVAMVVVAGGVGFNFSGTAVGAAIAYNYIGGSFDPANPGVVDQNTTATDAITAYIDNAGVDAGGDIGVQAGYQPPATLLPTTVRLPSETAISSVKVEFVRESGLNTAVYDYIQRDDDKTAWSDTSLAAGQTITVTGAGPNDDGTYVIDAIDGAKLRLRGVHNHVSTGPATIGIAIERGLVDISGDPSTATRAPFAAGVVSVTVGAAAANEFALGGSISINVIAHSISAYIAGAHAVKAGGSILISGADDLDAVSVAGGVAVGNNAAGIAVSLQIDLSKVSAYVGAGMTIDARGNGAGLLARNGTKDANGVPQTTLVKGLAISATSFEIYRTIAIGLAGAPGFGVAGSGGVTVVNRHVDAYIDDHAVVDQATDNVSPDQSVFVLASDRTDHVGAGGAIALGGSGGIGAGIDVGVMTKETKARIGAGTTVSAQDNVQVQAFSQEKVVSVAASGSAAVGNGIAGAVDVYVVRLTTKAFVDASSRVTAEGSVVVAAADKTEVDFIGGNAAVGGDAGIGGAIVVPVVTKFVYAYIGEGATVDAKAKKAGIDVRAGTFSHTFVPNGSSDTDEVQAPDIEPGNVGNPGPNDPNPLVDEQLTKRRVVTPDTLAGFKGVAVTALNQDDIGTFGIGVSGSGAVAVQISAGAHVMTAETFAYIADDAQVNQGADNEGSDQTVLVRAANDYTLLGAAGGAAVGLIVGVTPGVEVGVVDNTVEAYIGNDADVEAMKDVDVRASSAEDILAIGIAIGGSSTAGVGGAFAIVVVDDTTYAHIDDKAAVSAGANVVLSASDFSDVDNIAIGAGIGIAGAGVGVGVAVTSLTKDTRAWIGAATVDAKGNSSEILLRNPVGTGSERLYDGTQDAGSGAFGRLASGTDARGVAVVAESSENVLSLAIAGAGGLGAGVAGAVTVAILDSDTRAFVDDGAAINTDATGANAHQDLHVQATNAVTILDIAGSIGVGVAGVAGGVDVGIVHNDTTAFVAAGDVRAKRDVRVSALADRNIESFAISAGAGGLGLGAAVSVYALGGNLDATYSYTDDNGQTKSKDALSDPNTNVILGIDALMQGGDGGGNGASGGAGALDSIVSPKGNGSPGTTQNSGNIRSTAGSAKTSYQTATPASGLSGSTGQPPATGTVGTQTVPRGTSAFIGPSATVTAGHDVDLDAHEHVKLTMIGGGLGVGGAGVGAGIGILINDENIETFVGRGASVSAGSTTGEVSVHGSLDADLSVLGVTGGFGAIAGVAAAVVAVDDSSQVKAYLEDTSGTSAAKILAAGAVSLTAERTSASHISTLGAAAGFVGVGAAVVVVTVTGATQSFIGRGAQIGATTGTVSVGNVTVAAESTVTVNPFASAPVMGAALAAGAGAVSAGVVVVTIGSVSATTPMVIAEIRGSATLRVSGDVTVEATTTFTPTVQGAAGSVGFVAVGAVVLDVHVWGGTRADVGSGTGIDARSLAVSATDTTTATTNLLVVAIGLVGASGGGSTVFVDADTDAFLGPLSGSGSTRVRTTGNIAVKAISSQTANATASGGGVHEIGLSVLTARATLQSSTTAFVGDGTTIPAAGGLVVDAETPAASASASVVIGSGGGIDIAGASAAATSDPQLTAAIGDGVTIADLSNLTAPVRIAGDIVVTALGRAQANATGEADGGGVIHVGSPNARAGFDPSVDAHIGTAGAPRTTIVITNGSVKVTAQLLKADASNNALKSSATAGGGDGGIDDFAFPSATLAGTPSVLATLAAKTLDAGANVELNAFSAFDVESEATTAGGGGIHVVTAAATTILCLVPDPTKMTLDCVSPTIAKVAPGTSIGAAGNVTIDAENDHTISAKATANGGGGVSVNAASSYASLDNDVEVQVGGGSSIDAGGNLKLHVDSRTTGTTDSETNAVAGVGGSDSNHAASLRGLQIGSPNAQAERSVTIGAGAVLHGNTVDVLAKTSRLVLESIANALAIAIGAALANAELDVYNNTFVHVLGGSGSPRTFITGDEGVDLEARNVAGDQPGDIILIARHATTAGLVPLAETDGIDSLTSVVKTDAFVTVSAGMRAGPAGDLLASPIGLQLALYVAGVTGAVAFVTETKDDFVTGSAQNGSQRASLIQWDADVAVLGGAQGSPLLIVGPAGRVDAVNGVQLVRDSTTAIPGCTVPSAEIYTPSVNDCVDPDGNGSYTIADIGNSGYGDVFFQTSDSTTGQFTPFIENQLADGTSNHPWPVFEFRDTLTAVTIVDSSGLKLNVGRIDVVPDKAETGNSSSGDFGTVELSPGTFAIYPNNNIFPTRAQIQFDLRSSAAPTVVQIKKLAAGDIDLVGTINNPTGTTQIVAANGNVLTSAGLLVTNVLDVEAPHGSIGTAAAPLTADLIQFTERPHVDGPPTAPIEAPTLCSHLQAPGLQSPKLCARALGAQIAYRGIDRAPGTTLVVTTDVSAGGSPDINQLPTLNEVAVSISFDVKAIVLQEAAIHGWDAPGITIHTHFRPDGGTAVHDPAVFGDELAPVTGAGTGFTGIEGAEVIATVALFRDPDPSATPGEYSATIDWGDHLTASPGTIVPLGEGRFFIQAMHTYEEEGTYTATVTIKHANRGDVTVLSKAEIEDASLIAVVNGPSSPVTAGDPDTLISLILLDSNPFAPASDFSLTFDFGDGSTSRKVGVGGDDGVYQAFAFHPYRSSGTYLVAATVLDVGGSSSTGTFSITVVLPITASEAQVSAVEGAEFVGTVATFTVPDTAATLDEFSASIDWGDGSPSSTGTVVPSWSGSFSVQGAHRYAEEGSATVKVTITEVANLSNFATATSTTTVADAPLHAVTFTLPSPVFEHDVVNVSFSFADENANAPAGEFTSRIDWGDGQVSDPAISGRPGAYLAQAPHAYASFGVYRVSILVTDAGGSTTGTTGSIRVRGPIVASRTSFSAIEGASFSGPVATFVDPDTLVTANQYSAAIDWGDGSTSTATIGGSDGAFFVGGSHRYREEGSYTVTATITDVDRSSNTATVMSSATVSDALLIPGTVTVQSPVLETNPTSVTFTFRDQNPFAPLSDFTASIDWSDGPPSSGTIEQSLDGFAVQGSHTYVKFGVYAIRITVTDEGGSTTTTTASITVLDPPIVASGTSLSAVEGAAFSANVATFTDPDAPAMADEYSATVDWADGSPATAATVTGSAGSFSVAGTHTYADEGKHTVTVTITDIGNPTNSASATSTVTVADAPLHASLSAASSAYTHAAMGVTVTVRDDNAHSPAGDFTMTIDWGDGTQTSNVVVLLVDDQQGRTFTAQSLHTYVSVGTFPIRATVNDVGGSRDTVTASVIVHDQPIVAAGATFAATEGATFSGAVATFADPDRLATAAQFSAVIDWGDGSTSSATVGGSAGAFTVGGVHTYAEEGTHTVKVAITDLNDASNSATVSSSATVADAVLHPGKLTGPHPAILSGVTNLSFAFTDDNAGAPASDFTVMIDWGDGTRSAATVTGSGGSFVAQASHTYVALGSYVVTVTVTDKGDSTLTSRKYMRVVSGRATVKALVGSIDASIARSGSKHDRDALRAARRHFAAALDTSLWLDDTHVRTNGGAKVFDHAQDAVHRLHALLKDEKSHVPDAKLRRWIESVVSVARTLARTEIADAKVAGGDADRLAAAAQEMREASAELANGSPARAIDHFKRAWNLAEDALRRRHTAGAGPTGRRWHQPGVLLRRWWR
jgi:hypothetical protein